jgi:hypothetical protein
MHHHRSLDANECRADLPCVGYVRIASGQWKYFVALPHYLCEAMTQKSCCTCDGDFHIFG